MTKAKMQWCFFASFPVDWIFNENTFLLLNNLDRIE